MKPSLMLSNSNDHPLWRAIWWGKTSPFYKRESPHKCDKDGYNLLYMQIPIVGTGSQKKSLYRCPKCGMYYKNIGTKKGYRYTLLSGGWERYDRRR
jgi:hypothetical protein